MHARGNSWVHACGFWVHVCGFVVHVCGNNWVQSMRFLDAKYADVGCIYAETLGCKYVVVGCKSMERLGACLTVGNFA